jgi:uncharacterized membrane protein
VKIHLPDWSWHPNVRTGDQLTLAERIVDKLVQGMGSLWFIFWQTLLVAVWVTLNLLAIVHHWDPYPFILLNLAFSTQAAYATPMILLASRRNEKRLNEREEYEYKLIVKMAEAQGIDSGNDLIP